MRTIKPAKTEAGRRRQMARLRAEFDELRDAVPPPSAPSEPASDVGSIVRRELARERRAAEAQAAEADAARYRCPTGACWRCGVSEMQYTDGSPADWYPDGPDRHLCVTCKQVAVDRPFLDDSERRLLDITRLLGLSSDASAAWPMRPASDFDAIPAVLFAETNAEPSLVPWAHVDRE
jgi:hypothetical protein